MAIQLGDIIFFSELPTAHITDKPEIISIWGEKFFEIISVFHKDSLFKNFIYKVTNF